VQGKEPLYQEDLAYIHARAFGALARGAAPEIVRLLQAAAIPIRSVVDVGCGAGVLTAALIDAGFEATGIDSSAELLAIARAHVPQAHFVNTSVYDAALPSCQAIVALGEPLTYHADLVDAERRVRSLFQRASGILQAGGILIFDVIELGAPSLAGRSWQSGEDWAVMVETTEDREARTLVRKIETFRRVDDLYRRGREIHTVRLFDAENLRNQLAACGFAVETAPAYGTYRLPARRLAFFCTRR